MFPAQLVRTEHGGSVDCITGSTERNLLAYAEALPGLGASRVFVQDSGTNELVATIVDGAYRATRRARSVRRLAPGARVSARDGAGEWMGLGIASMR